MTLLVDASVAAKWFREEEHHLAAVALLDRPEGLAAPDLVLYEVGNIVWRWYVQGELSALDVERILAGLRDGLSKLYPSDPLTEAAVMLALSLRHPVYDCIYLACAEAMGAKLVTADRRLLRSVQNTPQEPLVSHVSVA